MPRASGAAATLLGYLLALAGLDGAQAESATQQLGAADLRTLATKLVQQLLLRSLGRGAVAVIELFARFICLILALLLSWSPHMRQQALNRVRAELYRHADQLHRLGLIPKISAPSLVFESCGEGSPHVLVAGDARVGKSALIAILDSFAQRAHVPLCCAELSSPAAGAWAAQRSGGVLAAMSAGGVSADACVGIVVWEAALERPLPDYAADYAQRLQLLVPPPRRPLPIIVICNKTDVSPCPLPEIEGLGSQKCTFIALSAHKGTNTDHIWEMVHDRLPKSPNLEDTLPKDTVRAAARNVTTLDEAVEMPCAEDPSAKGKEESYTLEDALKEALEWQPELSAKGQPELSAKGQPELSAKGQPELSAKGESEAAGG